MCCGSVLWRESRRGKSCTCAPCTHVHAFSSLMHLHLSETKPRRALQGAARSVVLQGSFHFHNLLLSFALCNNKKKTEKKAKCSTTHCVSAVGGSYLLFFYLRFKDVFRFSGLGSVTVGARCFLWPPGGQVGLDSVLGGVLSFRRHAGTQFIQNTTEPRGNINKVLPS